MKFQDKRKALAVAAIAMGAMFGSVNASAGVIIIGKATATAPQKGVIVVLPSKPTPGTVVTLPGANPLPVTRVVTAPAAPAPVVIVPPITRSGANKVLMRTRAV